MGLARFGISVFGAIALLAAMMAGATIWLVLTDPVTVADAVTEGEVSPFVRELTQVVLEALKGLLKYL
jgi:hypothetical protein